MHYVFRTLTLRLPELEHVAGLDAEVEAIRRGDIETRPMDALVHELGFDPGELRAQARGDSNIYD